MTALAYKRVSNASALNACRSVVYEEICALLITDQSGQGFISEPVRVVECYSRFIIIPWFCSVYFIIYSKLQEFQGLEIKILIGHFPAYKRIASSVIEQTHSSYGFIIIFILILA